MKRAILVRGAVSLVLATAFAVACGGSTTSEGGEGGAGSNAGIGSGSASGSGGGGSGGSSGSGSTGSSGSSGGTSDAAVPGCPGSPPLAGAACVPEGLTCEWGSSNVAGCDTIGVCRGGAFDFNAINPGVRDCGGGPPIACPSSYASVPVGQTCTPAGGYCDYSEGRCACGQPAGPVLLVDGSPAEIWMCQKPQSGCPQPRPRLGSSCSIEGQFCDYGGCGEVPGGSAEQCTGGVWVEAEEACPL
jgi:hypothetical protein